MSLLFEFIGFVVVAVVAMLGVLMAVATVFGWWDARQMRQRQKREGITP